MSEVKNRQVITKTILTRKSTKSVIKRIGANKEIIKTKVKEKRVTEIHLHSEQVFTNSQNNETDCMETDSKKDQDVKPEFPSISTKPHQQSEARRVNKLRTQLKDLLHSVVRELTITGGREQRRITAKDVADAIERHTTAVNN